MGVNLGVCVFVGRGWNIQSSPHHPTLEGDNSTLYTHTHKGLQQRSPVRTSELPSLPTISWAKWEPNCLQQCLSNKLLTWADSIARTTKFSTEKLLSSRDRQNLDSFQPLWNCQILLRSSKSSMSSRLVLERWMLEHRHCQNYLDWKLRLELWLRVQDHYMSRKLSKYEPFARGI